MKLGRIIGGPLLSFGFLAIFIFAIFCVQGVFNNYSPTYPVQDFGYGSFLADISQIIKIGPVKSVEVDIAEQKLKMFENDKLVNELSVSTGAKGTPTPVGNFKVLNKFVMVKTKTSGCWLPFWAGFTKDGLYGFHEVPVCAEGRRGEDKIGTPASIGCVRLSVKDSQTFYDWVEVGTPITIKNS